LLCLRISALAPWKTSIKCFHLFAVIFGSGEMKKLLAVSGSMISASASHLDA
jgi:hypothetical protein